MLVADAEEVSRDRSIAFAAGLTAGCRIAPVTVAAALPPTIVAELLGFSESGSVGLLCLGTVSPRIRVHEESVSRQIATASCRPRLTAKGAHRSFGIGLKADRSPVVIMPAWEPAPSLNYEMSPERAQAYRRVIHTLNDVGPSKVVRSEQDRIRHAVDSLIFSRDLLQDAAACEALKDMERLCRVLVDSGRWAQTDATRLVRDISQCGPPPPAELKAA